MATHVPLCEAAGRLGAALSLSESSEELLPAAVVLFASELVLLRFGGICGLGGSTTGGASRLNFSASLSELILYNLPPSQVPSKLFRRDEKLLPGIIKNSLIFFIKFSQP